MVSATNKWLESGSQTKITPEIMEVVSSIEGTGLRYLLGLMKYLKGDYHMADKNKFINLFRKRTAKEIIASNEVAGCSDYAVLFCALSRGKKIPTIYVEMPEKNWLESNDIRTFANHVFCRVCVNDVWYWVDPTRGNIGIVGPYNVGGDKEYVLFAEGLDSWDLGLKDWNSYTKKYLEFRKKWKRLNSM